MRKTITPIAIAVCAVLVLATGAAIAEREPREPPGPAQRLDASNPYPAPPGCTRGALCVYDDNMFEGRRYRFFGTNKKWNRWRINNNDESAYNNGMTGRPVTVYDTGFNNPSYCVRRGHGYRWYPDGFGSANRWEWRC